MTPRPSRLPTDNDVATFWAEGAPAATYYRGEIPGRALPANIAYPETHDPRAYQAEGKPAVLQNPWSTEAVAAIEILSANGSPIVVDLDDNLLIEPAFIKDVMPPFWTERNLTETMPRHRSIIDRADEVIATTPALADAYSKVHRSVSVIPHAIDPRDWEDIKKPADGVFRVGFAGSNAHYDDFPLIEPACRWASDQPGVEVVVIGIDPYWNFPYTHVAGVGLSQYRQELAKLDVGLCPLVRNEWSICRSDGKPLEYTLAGAAVIASHAEPFIDWQAYAAIVQSADEFFEAVQWSVSNQDEVEAVAASAREYVLAERSISVAVTRWREVLTPSETLDQPLYSQDQETPKQTSASHGP